MLIYPFDVIRTCPICATLYEADPGRLKLGRQKTCSRACSYRLRASARSNRQCLTCATCGAEVRRSPHRLARVRHAVFCSRACHYAGRATGATRRVVTDPYVYTPQGKAAMMAASMRPKGQRRFHPTTCASCGITFDDPSDGRARSSGLSFCSLPCCNAYRKGPNNPAWRGGHPNYYGPDWRRLRREVRARDATCPRCGAPPRRALDVHHIKSVAAFANPNDANTLDNLVALCHHCHMFVEWNGIDFPLQGTSPPLPLVEAQSGVCCAHPATSTSSSPRPRRMARRSTASRTCQAKSQSGSRPGSGSRQGSTSSFPR